MISPQSPDARKGALLIVDDEECIRDVLGRHFTAEGYDCRSAGSVAQAKDRLESAPFDLVLTDLLMPEESGFGLLDTVRKHYPETGVMFLTAVSDAQVAIDAVKLGACDFISKPIHLEKAQARVEAALRRREQGLAEKRYYGNLETVCERYVSPEMLSHVHRDHGLEELLSKTIEATILFCDVRGFSALSRRTPALELIPRLNAHYFEPAIEIITAHQGMVNKIIGDGIMAVFGAPRSSEDHAARAAAAAREILLKVHQPAGEDGERFSLGIGIASGPVISGNVGGSKHMAYTVMGDAVNTAAQLEKLAGPGEMLLSEETYEALPEKIPARLLWATLKGREDLSDVYRVEVRP